MCKAYVLRFSCKHGVLMGFELCRIGPCPFLRTCSERLPQQPYKCYNCQYKLDISNGTRNNSNAAISPISSVSHSHPRPLTSRGSSCSSSTDSIVSHGSDDSASTSPPRSSPTSSISSASSFPAPSKRNSHTTPSAPLPGVYSQPSGNVRMSMGLGRGMSMTQAPSLGKQFGFACNGSSHFPPPHYANLPSYLPHQDHSCPPCQLEELRQQSYREVSRQATKEWPMLTTEMLVRNGTIKEWQAKPSLAKYVDERYTEDRETWHHVTRKWTMDLKRLRVLVAEEDGLGLFA